MFGEILQAPGRARTALGHCPQIDRCRNCVRQALRAGHSCSRPVLVQQDFCFKRPAMRAVCSSSSAKSHCFGNQHADVLTHRALPVPFRHVRSRSNARPPQRAAPVSKEHTADTEPTKSAPGNTSSSNRRLLLTGLAVAAAALAPACTAAQAKLSSGDWSSPGLAAPEDPLIPKFFKTASGVKVQETVAGSAGPEVQPGDAVLLDYVLRRSNGYFIYGTQEGVSFQPKDVPVGPVLVKLGSGTVVPGLEEALLGMRQGGKRRVLVPPEQGYTSAGGVELQPQPPTFATKRQLANHAREPLLFEIEVLRVNKRA